MINNVTDPIQLELTRESFIRLRKSEEKLKIKIKKKFEIKFPSDQTHI
jgi:hypothetical protein